MADAHEWDWSDLRLEWLRLRYDIAKDRLDRTLGHHGGEVKYRKDQARLPGGVRGGHGGRFADEGRGTARTAARQAARAGASAAEVNPEGAAMAASAIGLPAAGAAVGVSRAGGLYAHYATGAAITPMLHIPSAPLDLTMGVDLDAARYAEGRIKDECVETYETEYDQCTAYAVRRGLQAKAKNRTLSVCYANAAERLEQCMQDGGSKSSHTPLFLGVK